MDNISPRPSHWKLVQLGEICTVDWGNTAITKASYKTLGYPAFSAKGQDGLLDFFEHDGKGVILSAIGARCGKCFLANGKWTAIKNTIVIKPITPQVDIDYLFHTLNDETFWHRSGSGQPFIAIGRAKEQSVWLPPLPEQQAIAHTLRTVQQAKEATENVIAAARQLKQSLMRHLFTYGAVPFREANRVKLTRTAIGTIPAGWSIKDLHSITRSGIKNGAFIKRNRFGTGVPFLNVADIYKDLVAQLSLTERVAASEEELRLYGLAPGDIIFVRSSLKREGIGQCCIIDSVPGSAIYDCHLMRVRVNDSLCDPKFVVYYFSSPGGRKSVISLSKTTTMTTINQKSLGSAVMPVPPIAEQCAIRKTLESIDEKIRKEEARQTNTDSVFRCLLQALMSGTIRASSRNTPQKVDAI